MQQFSQIAARLLTACCCLVLGACTDPLPVVPEPDGGCGPDGRLVAEIYGGLRVSIDWHTADLECEGMLRPAGEGARLRFAGNATAGQQTVRLAFILGLPELAEGQTGTELPTNVTVIEEGSGRFFSTRGAGACWTDVRRHERLPGAAASVHRIGGMLYCVSPLADLSSNASVSITEIAFTGLLDWKTP